MAEKWRFKSTASLKFPAHRLTFQNPAYLDAERMGRWTRNIPRVWQRRSDSAEEFFNTLAGYSDLHRGRIGQRSMIISIVMSRFWLHRHGQGKGFTPNDGDSAKDWCRFGRTGPSRVNNDKRWRRARKTAAFKIDFSLENWKKNLCNP